MDYLVVCKHLKTLISAKSPMQARDKFSCFRCTGVDLSTGETIRGDVRVYAGLKTDVIAIQNKKIPKRKPIKAEQLDWVSK